MPYEFACTFVHETDNAVLVRDPASDEEIWIPLSAVVSMHRNVRGEGTIEIEDWIARKKGLI